MIPYVPFVYWFATRFTRYCILPLYTRIRITGLENIPLSGPLIVVCNHLNDADPGILCTRIPRRIVYMAKSEFFTTPLLGQFMRAFGAFPVERDQPDLAALRLANETLTQGLALGIFPEGRTSTTAARMNQARPGAALVALRSQAPILPVAITGSQHLQLPQLFLRVWQRYDVGITIGEPFSLPKPPRLNAAAAEAGTLAIMAKIAALLPEQYRGYYGEVKSPANRATTAVERSGE